MNLPNVEFWKVVVSLGVPGLALGVFYMLFRSFKWNFPMVPTKWVGPIIVLFMVLTAGLTFVVLFYWAPSSHSEHTKSSSGAPALGPMQKSHLSFNYMRLFGAYQVPMLMETIVHNYYGGKREAWVISNNLWTDAPLYKFWASWQYSKSKPLKTNLWDEFAPLKTNYGNEVMEIKRTELLCAAFGNDQLAKDYFSIIKIWRQNCGLPHEELEEYVDRKYRDLLIRSRIQRFTSDKIKAMEQYNTIERYIEKKSQNVGFLFIIIENISDDTLEDIHFMYKEFKCSNISYTLPRIAEGCVCPNANIDMSKYPSREMVLEQLRTNAKENEKVLYKLGKGESVIWLLSVYLKDDFGFPAKYLSNSVVQPIRISYRNASYGTSTEIKVREPLGQKAAAIMVPIGWYGQ